MIFFKRPHHVFYFQKPAFHVFTRTSKEELKNKSIFPSKHRSSTQKPLQKMRQSLAVYGQDREVLPTWKARSLSLSG